jgi:hypothetical protein
MEGFSGVQLTLAPVVRQGLKSLANSSSPLKRAEEKYC